MRRLVTLLLLGGVVLIVPSASAELVLEVSEGTTATTTSEGTSFVLHATNSGDEAVSLKLWAELLDEDGTVNSSALGRSQLRVEGENRARVAPGDTARLQVGTEALPAGTWRIRWSAMPQLSDDGPPFATIQTDPLTVEAARSSPLLAAAAVGVLLLIGVGVGLLLWNDRRLTKGVVTREQMAEAAARWEAKQAAGHRGEPLLVLSAGAGEDVAAAARRWQDGSDEAA